MKKTPPPTPKLPFYFQIGATLSAAALVLILVPLLIWFFLVDTEGSTHRNIATDENFLPAIMLFSGITLMFPACMLSRFANDPEAFFAGNPMKSFLPVFAASCAWVWFLMAFLIDALIHNSSKKDVKNTPEVMQRLAESYSEHSWILTASISASALCLLVVGYLSYRYHYRKRSMLPNGKTK